MGSVHEVEALFAAVYPQLVRALALSFGQDIAEEAVADAFVQADRRGRRVSAYEDPTAWIRRVAINRAIDASRRAARRNRQPDAQPDAIEDPAALTDALVDLHTAVQRLPPAMRTIFSLFYLAELTVAEIAAACAVSPGTVKSTLHEARRQLRPALQETE